jgi:hypothetical protein
MTRTTINVTGSVARMQAALSMVGLFGKCLS